MARMRQTAYQCDAEQMSQLTVHLERTKLRLRLLKIRAQSCPPEYQVALEPLFEEAGRRIGELREKRNAIPRGSGGPGRIAGL